MRGKIFEALVRRMENDPSVFFLSADMGINLIEQIQQRFPDRFLNVGIAEQNLIGVASGLCNAGFRPFVYTITNFLVHRCFEQVRNDVALHGYPITLLGTSVGFDNAPLGPTHHILDDWGVIRALPGVDIYAPSTAAYAETLIDRIVERGRPAFVRIAKGAPKPDVPNQDVDYLPMAGARTLLISYGTCAQDCLAVQAARSDVSVMILNQLHPLDAGAMTSAMRDHSAAVIVEDHYAHCGLYAQICQIAVANGLTTRITSLAPEHAYALTVATSTAGYHKRCGMDAAGITAHLDQIHAHS